MGPRRVHGGSTAPIPNEMHPNGETPMTGTTKVRHLLLALLVAASLVPALPVDAQEPLWFHLRVEEPGTDGVSLSLPLSLVEVALDVADRNLAQDEGFPWGGEGQVSVADLRRMWGELSAAGDADFVEIHEGRSHVRISRLADRILLTVDEGDATRVRLETPASVVDALLGTEGERLDLPAAVRELVRGGTQDLLSIQDGDTTVRIWIAERPAPARSG